MMCAIMNKLRPISAAARHRLVLDLRILVVRTGESFPAAAGSARREIGPVVFNSRLMQPLFTSFPGFYAKTRCAPMMAGNHKWTRIDTNNWCSLVFIRGYFLPCKREY